MSRSSNAFRHLPPTAVPVQLADLRAGLVRSPESLPQFKAALASYLGVDPVACKVAASGRTAFYCMLQGMKAQRPQRNQVVMPAYTCPAVARVVVDLNLIPVFVDIALETMTFDRGLLAAATSEQTLAIVHVHPFGIPLPIEDVLSLAEVHGAYVVEDAAQALGAAYDGQPLGRHGDFGLYSLGPGKPISTGGGGIAIANNVGAVQALEQAWANLPAASGVKSAAAWVRQVGFKMAFQPNIWWAATRAGLQRLGNHEASWGYTVEGLSPSQASVGLQLLPRLDNINDERRRKGSLLRSAVGRSHRLQTLRLSAKARPFFLRFPLFAENEEQREQLFASFWAAGIGAGRLYEKTLPSLFDSDAKSYPGAEAVAGRLLTLPTHHRVTPQDLALMIGILQEVT